MSGFRFCFDGRSFLVEGDGNYRFDDCKHLYNFLNYLYRSDRAQKWTNEATRENLDIQCRKNATATKAERGREKPADINPMERFGSPEHCQLLHDFALNKLKTHYKTSNLMASKAAKYAHAFVIDAMADGEVPPETWNGLIGLLQPALRECSLTLMSAVVHNDQGAPHLHGLYLQEQGMRGNPFEVALLYATDLEPCIVADF